MTMPGDIKQHIFSPLLKTMKHTGRYRYLYTYWPQSGLFDSTSIPLWNTGTQAVTPLPIMNAVIPTYVVWSLYI